MQPLREQAPELTLELAIVPLQGNKLRCKTLIRASACTLRIPKLFTPNSSFTQNLHHSATAPELTPRSPVAPNDQLFQHSELTEISQISQISQRTQAMIQEVKGALNLSSDAEVINMMVTLGYKQIKNLLA